MVESNWEAHTAPPLALRLYLLGPPAVEWAGNPLLVSRRQARALLFRLACRPQPVPREHLCALLWPDVSEALSHRSLTHLLTHLRRALPHPELIVSTSDDVQLNTARVWTDTVEFERLCQESGTVPENTSVHPISTTGGKSAGAEPSREPLHTHKASKALEQAVALYRGAFLEGFSLPNNSEFETWMEVERDCWKQLYLRVLNALVNQLTAENEHDTAIRYALRYLAVDELAESMHRRLMGLYAVLGDRAGAVRQFMRCKERLQSELGVEPAPETVDAYHGILKGRAASAVRVFVPPERGALPKTEPPFVGRQEALNWLHQQYAETQRGRGRVILVAGEVGVGKTRLIQHFIRPLADQCLILTAQCYPSGRTIPFHPIVQALRAVLSKEARDRVKRDGEQHGQVLVNNATSLICASLPQLPRFSAAVWLAEASRLLPDLNTIYAELPSPIRCEPEEARTRLFEALCRLVIGLTNASRFVGFPNPVIVFLDDIHWADDATLAWLSYLGQQIRSWPLLVIGAYRVEEADAVAELRRNLSLPGALQELELSELNLASVMELCRFFLTDRPGGEEKGDDTITFAGRLTEVTGGNPFFVLETLKALREMGRLPGNLEDAHDIPLPSSVREAMEERIRHLGEYAQQIIEAGAVLGLSFDFEPVQMTAGLVEIQTLQGLDELVRHQLLEEEQTGYRFHHELTQRIVEAQLSPMRLQLLHRRAGRALEQLRIDQPTTLAHHYEVGGDARSALYYYQLAEQRAEALFAWREAEGYLGKMLTLIDRLDPDSSDAEYLNERGQILASRAHMRFLQGRLAERDADLSALETLAQTSGDEELRMQFLIHRVRYLNLDSQYENAIATASESLTLADRLHNPIARSRLLVQVGFAHYFLGHPQQALTALKSALAVEGADTDREMRGRIFHILGYVYFHLGDFARSLACQLNAYECHQAVGDYNRLAWDGLDIGALYLEQGDFVEARRWLDEGLALARRIGAQPAEAHGLTQLGCWELHQGHYLTAAGIFQQSLVLQAGVRSEHGQAAAEMGTGLALYHLGDLVQARHWLERAAARARSIRHLRRMAETLVGLGLAESADGQISSALAHLHEAVQIARVSECGEALAVGLAALARIERRSGELAHAVVYAEEAVRVARENALPVCERWGEMELGLAVLAQGRAALAQEHTSRAVALASGLHEAWIGSEDVYAAHTVALKALGRHAESEEHQHRAEAILQAKAEHISDPDLRRRYILFAQSQTA